uniref:Uncharacterized protein n=1 Tax=Leersia perrieri TaxID=77586 RepID=A0A0D9XDT2_9ORYZ
MASAVALKIAALCMLILCSIGSQVMIVRASSTAKLVENVVGSSPRSSASPAPATVATSATPARQNCLILCAIKCLMDHELAAELRLAGDDSVGDVCSPACQTCLIVCAIKCVLKPNPTACYADCIVTDKCFTL